MNSNINLLGNKQKESSPKASRRLKIMRGIAVGLLFTVSVSSMILFILIALSPLPQLQKQEKNYLFTLSQYNQEVIKLALIKDRLTAIDSLLTTRKSYDAVIASIRSKMPPGVKIIEMNVGQKNISLTVSSTSLQLLNTFADTVTRAAEENKEYTQVILSDLSETNQNNNFLLTVSLGTL